MSDYYRFPLAADPAGTGAALRALGAGLEEDTGARPNPTLRRIRPVRPDAPDGRG